MASAFDKERLAKKKQQLAILDQVILDVESVGIARYSLDTGQSKTDVTKTDIPAIYRIISRLENEINMLEARCTGSNVRIGGVGF